MPKSEAESIVNLFINEMSEALAKGNRVELSGFGSFFVKEYEEYTGRNPKIWETVQIAPKKLPFLLPELNPDEKLNCDLKDAIHSRPRDRTLA